MKGTLAFRPFFFACRAIDATRDMSSYDELVHEPMRPAERLPDQPFEDTKSLNLLMGVERSGVNGPLM